MQEDAGAVLYCPAAQLMQEGPVLSTYLPGGHAVHEVNPAAVLYCPAAQSMHAEAPAAFEYFPAAQS